MITIQFMVAMVESYIVVAAGFIFLGFGGSRWTAPYAERYIGLAVSNGVKILVIYLLISVGTNLGNAWVAEAQGASTSATPEMVALDVMAAALMYMMLCWQIPKLFSAVLGGSPALSGGDLIAAGSSLVVGTAAVAAAASGGAGVLAGGARTYGGVAAAANAGAGGFGSDGTREAVQCRRHPQVVPESLRDQATSGSPTRRLVQCRRQRTSPRRRAKHRRQAAQLAKLLTQREKLRTRSVRCLRGCGILGRRLNSVLPPDHAPHSTPPRMDIDHHE